MNQPTWIGFLILFLMAAMIVGFALLRNRWRVVLRPLKGYDRLGQAIEQAVEAGDRVHLSLGTGGLVGMESAPALAGLAVLARIASLTAMSDKPAIVTSSNGAFMLLAQDTLRTTYRRMGELPRFELNSGRMLGPTPYTYSAAIPDLLDTEQVSVHVLHGSFGPEAALASVFGERAGAFVLAGTDDVQAQALMVATAEEVLIGEEVFAGSAYLDNAPFHRSSLQAQDALRFALIILIVLGAILRTLGVLA